MLTADDYDADLAERYGWISRALPANALDDFGLYASENRSR